MIIESGRVQRKNEVAPNIFAGGGIIPSHPLARVLYPRAPASRSARVRRRAPFLGGRLACRAVAPYHVVKMRRSFSLRVVGVTPPHPLARVLHPRAPCGGIIPPHPHTIALSLFHAFVLSRSCAENFRLWGYPPPTPLRGYYTLAPPYYLFIAHSNARFVKEQRRKNLQGKLAKFFAPLTTTKSYNS